MNVLGRRGLNERLDMSFLQDHFMILNVQTFFCLFLSFFFFLEVKVLVSFKMFIAGF